MTFIAALNPGWVSRPRFARLHPRLASQNETGRVRLGDRFPILMADLTLDVADVLAAIRHPRLGAQQRSPDRAKKADVERHRRERFIASERRGEGHPHCGVSQVTKHASVHGAHWV